MLLNGKRTISDESCRIEDPTLIAFSQIPHIETLSDFVQQAIQSGKLAGGNQFSRKCSEWLKSHLDCKFVQMLTSCTHGLELGAWLSEIGPGDEVIMPSYTFPSTANAFVARGAKIRFIDIRSDTMNMDESQIEAALTSKTKVICPVHYGGVGCEMDSIIEIAQDKNLIVIEDAAQTIFASYKSRPLGTFGDLGTLSFHETKNITSGEGGAAIVNRSEWIERSEIICEKGTDRSRFFRGETDKYSWITDKYSWIDVGSSYLMSDLNAALLWAQLLQSEKIHKDRMATWNFYHDAFEDLERSESVRRPQIPTHCQHNAHIYYLKVRDLEERTKLLSHLREQNIFATFHYVPLHSSEAGSKYGEFVGADIYTTKESEKLIRLPLFFGMTNDQRSRVYESIIQFFN